MADQDIDFNAPVQGAVINPGSVVQNFYGDAARKLRNPYLLPYLSDRTKQVRTFREHLRGFVQARHDRPLLCIVHGLPEQCHDNLLLRLHRNIIPEELGPETQIREINPIMNAETRDPQDLIEQIAAKLQCPPKPDDLRRRLYENAGLVSIRLELEVVPGEEDAQSAERKTALLRDWIAWWRAFDRLTPERPTFVFTSIVLAELPGGLLGRFKKVHERRCNEALLDWLASEGPSQGLVLERLESVSRSDVMEWVELHGRAFAQVQELKNGIRDLFKKNEDRPLPMRDLAEHLKPLIQQYALDLEEPS